MAFAKVCKKVLSKTLSKVIGGFPIPAGAVWYIPWFGDTNVDQVSGYIQSFDDRDSDATIEQSNGSYVTYSPYEFPYRSGVGAHFQPEATNELFNSGLDNNGTTITDWSVSGSFTSNSAGDYNELTFVGGASSNQARRSVTLTASTIGCFHVRVKDASNIEARDVLGTRLFSDGGADVFYWNGTQIPGVTVISGDGLLQINKQINTDVAGEIIIGTAGVATGQATVFIPQVEDDTETPTSPIITPTGATATRLADDPTLATSDGFVDNECYCGGLTSGAFINGVNTSAFQITMFGGVGIEGKYIGLVTTDWIGAILCSDSGVLLEITGATAPHLITYAVIKNPTGLSDADAVQAGFEYPNLFQIDFSTSAYDITTVKALRASVGDGSTWIDTPLTDYFIESIAQVVNADGDHYFYARYVDANNYELLAYLGDVAGASFKVGYRCRVGGVDEEVTYTFSTQPATMTNFKVRVEKDTTGGETRLYIDGTLEDTLLLCNQLPSNPNVSTFRYAGSPDETNYIAVSNAVGDL